VTFSVINASGASISAWSFIPVGQPQILRTNNLSSSSWTGVMAASGTAQVTVVRGGVTYSLARYVQVTARAWSWSPVVPIKVPNGTIVIGGTPMILPSPPYDGSRLGLMQLQVAYSFVTQPILDDGPNHGFQYVTQLLPTSGPSSTRFMWQTAPDLDANTQFFRAQCGNYNPQTGAGFIDGPVLRSNVTEHESGTTRGHYQQYIQVHTPANNLVAIAESAIAAPGTTAPAFVAALTQELNDAVGRVVSATTIEACNAYVNYDTACQFRGPVNYSPYTRCR
jgi:hypothetical protein